MALKKKSGTKRQLVIFVNLEGVNLTKRDVFLKFAQERARNLNVTYSALNLYIDNRRRFQYQDVRCVENGRFFPCPVTYHSLKQQQILNAKNEIFSDFKRNAVHLDGQYDYILIVGEMVRAATGNSISEICQLNELSVNLKRCIENYANKNVHLRVQICFSAQVTLPGLAKTFSSSLVPEGRNVSLSAPTGWSIVGRNGAAIDFNLVNDVTFNAWSSFLSSAILNQFDVSQLVEKFEDLENVSKKKKIEWKKLIDFKSNHPEFRIGSLNIKLHYPSQKSYEKIFEELHGLQLRNFTPIPARSTPSSSPYFFRTITPTAGEMTASAPSPKSELS